jgi:hypothetical protein
MSNQQLPSQEPQSFEIFELELLKQEYFFIQNTIEDYNKQIWAIKALGIAGTGAVLSLMLDKKAGVSGSAIALVGCVIPLFFWLLESQWKHFQRGFYPRVVEIESILAESGMRGPAIFGGWSRVLKRTTTPKRNGYVWDGLLNPSVFISYVLEIGFLLIMAAIAPHLGK